MWVCVYAFLCHLHLNRIQLLSCWSVGISELYEKFSVYYIWWEKKHVHTYVAWRSVVPTKVLFRYTNVFTHYPSFLMHDANVRTLLRKYSIFTLGFLLSRVKTTSNLFSKKYRVSNTRTSRQHYTWNTVCVYNIIDPPSCNQFPISNGVKRLCTFLPSDRSRQKGERQMHFNDKKGYYHLIITFFPTCSQT